MIAVTIVPANIAPTPYVEATSPSVPSELIDETHS